MSYKAILNSDSCFTLKHLETDIFLKYQQILRYVIHGQGVCENAK